MGEGGFWLGVCRDEGFRKIIFECWMGYGLLKGLIPRRILYWCVVIKAKSDSL